MPTGNESEFVRPVAMSSVSSMPSNAPDNETTKHTAFGLLAKVFRAFLNSVSRRLAARSPISAIFAKSWCARRKWIDEHGLRRSGCPLANSSPARPRVRSGSRSEFFEAPGFWAGWRRGLGFTMPSALILLAFRARARRRVAAARRRRIPAWAEAGGRRRGGASRLGHGANARPAIALRCDDRACRDVRGRHRRGISFAADCRDLARGPSPDLLFAVAKPALPFSGRLRFPVSRQAGMTALALFAALFVIPLLLSRLWARPIVCSKPSIGRAR